MPYTIQKTFPAAVTLGTLTPVYTALAALSNLTGAWVADSAYLTQSGGAASNMDFRIGSGAFAQANGGRQPTVATRDGRGVLRFDGSKCMSISAAPGTVTAITVAMGFYQTGTTDAQNLFGAQGSPVWRAAFRNSPSGTMFYRADSGSDADTASAADRTGWNTLIMTQGSGLTKISLNGGAFVQASNTNAVLASFSIGSATDSLGSFVGDIRCVGLWSTDKSGASSDLATIRAWLDLETGRI